MKSKRVTIQIKIQGREPYYVDNNFTSGEKGKNCQGETQWVLSNMPDRLVRDQWTNQRKIERHCSIETKFPTELIINFDYFSVK